MKDLWRDPGLQPERTFLAWRRTALALVVVGLLLGRSAMLADSPWIMAVSTLVLIAAGSLSVIAAARHSTLLHSAEQQAAPHAWLLQATVAVCLLVCGTVLIAV